MPHHYPKSVVQAQAWCPTCNTQTLHYVWDGRLGRCMNEHPHAKPDGARPEGTLDLFPRGDDGRER